MLFWDPAFSGCDASCPANLLLVHGSRAAWDAASEAGAAVNVVLTVIVVVLIVQHWRSARGWSRQAMTPLVWIALVIGVESLVTDVTGLYRLPPLANLVFNGWAPLVNVLGPVLFVISTIRARTARGALGTAIVDLEPGAPPGRLRDTLARALGDSTLQLAFRDPHGFTDTAGLAVDPARPDPGRAVVPLTGDAERRRLERDLHDGAQQRLVTLTLALGMARSRVAGVDPELEALIEAAGKEAKEALTELRELARGIHPAVLTETGLAGAVQALVERSPVAVTITEVPRERFPAVIEATAYFVVSEALANVAKHARAGTAQVSIRRLPGRLAVQVSDDGAGGARPERGSGLAGLADRVASAGGVLRVDSPPGAGTRLEADIPCP
jgi:signal transduction histidine kinase